ncbi:hypothetical protein B0H12DRAFT_1107330 [Mycena haematopus]|nr:hypothetical protein B0H12DRAFT_1107330 [Mycena haematopus]
MPRQFSSRCLDACGIILVLSVPSGMMIWIFRLWNLPLRLAHSIVQTISIDKTLRSRITSNTPISGFYGPGSWWAFLITLAMTHGHTGMALLRTRQLPSERWDYDLIGASSYIVAAAIDLIHKSRTIARLGDKASESMLLPALVCAERVVSVGTGSSLFSLSIALVCGGLSRWRTLSVATIPLIFALTASAFCLRAHDTISRTRPVIWCVFHYDVPEDGSPLQAWILFTPVDVLAGYTRQFVYLAEIYLSPRYWLVVGECGVVVAILVFIVCLVQRRHLGRALWPTACAGLMTPVVLSALLMAVLVFWVAFGSLMLAGCWILLWWSIYILAFFPLLGFFPLTGTSVFEMDQIAALLGILVIAMIRTLRPIITAVHFFTYSSHEGITLLPVSSSERTTDNPE